MHGSSGVWTALCLLGFIWVNKLDTQYIVALEEAVGYWLLKHYWRAGEYKSGRRQYVPECFGSFLIQGKYHLFCCRWKEYRAAHTRSFCVWPEKDRKCHFSFMLKPAVLLKQAVVDMRVVECMPPLFRMSKIAQGTKVTGRNA